MLEHRLSDGTAVWLDPMSDVRSVALGIYVAAGSADEASGERGATHFLEHLLFKRSRRRSGAAIARMTDRLGGECDAYTTKDAVAFHARTTAERADEALDLLIDLTGAPAFTAADVEVERDVILEEMAEAKDIPEDFLHEVFLRQLWPAHPLGAPILGTDESVRSLSRTHLAKRFRAIFRPERTLFVAAGACEPGRLLARLEKARGRGTAAAPIPAVPPRPPGRPRARRPVLEVPRPDLTQAHLLVGAPTIPFGHRLRAAASIAVTVLGGGVSSRLWRDVREAKGLAYSVGAGLTLHREAGLALVEAATHPRNLPRLVRTTGRHLRRFRDDGPTRAELRRAKDQIRAEVALSLESTASRREVAARAFLYRGRPVSADEFLAEIGAVTAGEAAEASGLLFGAFGPVGLGISGPPVPGVTADDLMGELAA
ncbi:MAG TPA: pitrilysin family protein [Thermoanaerobaculia bacterium]|nr:pitrilysin family protein [Thermoanaerobaculia bacterium]